VSKPYVLELFDEVHAILRALHAEDVDVVELQE